MGKLKFTIHPLFIAYGIYFAFCGKVFSFIVYLLSAIVHEIGHSFASERFGYKLNKISLMPYGAVIVGDIDNLKFVDEIEIALFGPLFNLLVAVSCIALWWIVPESYAYTTEIVVANLFIGLINLLPCFPLDGGRILNAVLVKKIGLFNAKRVLKIITVAFSLGFVALFVLSFKNRNVNFSPLFFALFMVVGAFSKNDKLCFIKTWENYSYKQYKRGVEIKRIAIFEDATVLDLLRLAKSPVDVDIVGKNGKIKSTLKFDRVQKIITDCDVYLRLGDVIKSD
ncbi:MAG: site-2 protease family protein [Christensenellaceae bacterium]